MNDVTEAVIAWGEVIAGAPDLETLLEIRSRCIGRKRGVFTLALKELNRELLEG